MKLRRSYLHVGGEAPLLGATIGDCLTTMAARFPDREALVSRPQSCRLTYAALADRVDELALALIALGVERGDRVGIWSTNNLEWVLMQLATGRIGAILVNVNPAYRIAELEHGLRLARVQHLCLIPSFRSSDYVGMITELCPELRDGGEGTLRAARLPDLRHVIVYDPDAPESTKPPQPGMLAWQDLLALAATMDRRELDERAETVDPDDPVNIQFTSGTTGAPKAVLLTHHGQLNNGFTVGEILGLTEADRLCVPVPFYHCFGMVVSNLACLTHGAAIVIPSPHFEAGSVLEAVEAERCTAIHGVPTMFVKELEHEDFPKRDLSSLRTGIMAGAPCPPPLLRRVIDDMGCRDIRVAYGLTESSPVTHITRAGDSEERRTETVGINLPHQETKVIDPETGATVPIGVQGEVCLRGYHVMRGYYGDEAGTRQVIDDAGWLHSGDLGVMDEDGYLSITGRLKDMIIRGGENIYPAEIEAFYYGHPKVADIAVFGVPDERMGEEVVAWITLHNGHRADPEELRQYARERIAHYKVPRIIRIVDEFPMTVTGKIQKFRMRELEAASAEAVPH